MQYETISLYLPCKVRINAKQKYFTCNLNEYRRTHYFILNKAKKRYQEIVKDILNGCDLKAKKIIIEYMFVPCNKRRLDFMNFIAIVDKFFCDALVEIGVIEDDSTKNIQNITVRSLDVDKSANYHYVICRLKCII